MPVLSLLIAFAAAQAPAGTTPGASAAKQILQDCNAHKFDTVISADVEGKMQSKRLRLCGQVGQSDSDWLKTLEDSVAKLESSESIAKPMREAMMTSLMVEIVRLRSTIAPAASAEVRDFTLKPRAVPPKPGSGLADYHGLPPLPDPLVVKPAEAAAYVPPPPIVRPDIDFKCFTSGSIAEGPCDELDRHGYVVVRAKKAVGPGVALHFFVNGEDRGDIALSGTKSGQRRNLTLPGNVCRATAVGKLEMRVMVQPENAKFPPQRAETIGPTILRCT